MSWNTTPWKRGRFETLEQRHLLAGDVAIDVVRGDLVVEGDDLDNHIQITEGANPGTFLITGLNSTMLIFDGGTPTTSVTVEVRDGARIDLGAGNNTLEFNVPELDGGLSIVAGEGNDTITIGPAAGGSGGTNGENGALAMTVDGSLRIRTDGGNDVINVDDVSVRGSLDINAGDGDDTANLGSLTATPEALNAGAAGNARGLLGGLFGGLFGGIFGNDSDLEGRVRVRGGVTANMGDGTDTVNMHQLSARFFGTLSGGAGDDTFDVQQSHLLGLSVNGGDGEDDFTAVGLDLHFLTFNGGDDNDNAAITDSAFALLTVSMGDGDDVLAATDVEARFALLSGGDGEDTFNQAGVNDFGREIIRSFELPVVAPALARREPIGPPIR